MGSQPGARVALLLVAAFAAGTGATLALPSSAPAVAPPAAPQVAPAALALWLATGAALAGELALDAVRAPAGAAPGPVDGGERTTDPAPIPEWWTGGDDPSGPWPVA
jgi:hypothetical protein